MASVVAINDLVGAGYPCAHLGRLYAELERVELPAPQELIESEDDLKEWVWQNCKDTLLSGMKIECKQKAKPKPVPDHQRLRLLDKISQIQRRYLQMEEPRVVFGCLLKCLLELTDSEYGFIGECKYDASGIVYLQTHAITNIAWDAATEAFYDENAENGLKFTNLKSLFGSVMTTKQAVISNATKTDPRACGIPDGHPPLTYFLGIPFFEQGGEIMNGMVGIANKPGGYTRADIDFLEPVVTMCSNLIQAYSAMQQNKDLINNLEEKVAARTNALKVANTNLEQANRRVMDASAAQLKHFACMSHEIRTPLNCITGLSSLMLESSLTPAQKDSLQMMVTSGDLLLAVVNDVLDFSKLQSSNVSIDICQSNLQTTLDAVVNSIENKAHERNLTVQTIYDVAVPEIVDTDSRRLQQILYNLLGNAIKFSKDGSRVELHVTLASAPRTATLTSNTTQTTCEQLLPSNTQRDDLAPACSFLQEGESPDVGSVSESTESTVHGSEDCISCPRQTDASLNQAMLRFVVKDYGTGIEKDHFEKIFEPFQQATGYIEREHGGTGLGLAITSGLVKGLGGTISVDSKVDEWSTFTVDLPLRGKGVDMPTVTKKLESAKIMFINDKEKESSVAQAFRDYNVAFSEYESCDQLDAMAETKGLIDPNILYVCLIDDSLYRSESYERFAANAKTILVTFGPDYMVPKTELHFRSLAQVLPSVLMQSIADHAGPLRQAPSLVHNTAVPSAPLKHAALGDMRILIAEDNIINQKVLTRTLQKMGLKHIDIVDNGRKAVDQSAKKPYDLIFMDMQMPEMDGIEACRLIIQRESEVPTPLIVFVTANVSDSFEAETKDAGGSGFISKPFNLKILEEFFLSLD